MSAIGSRTAVVSLGATCQIAHQITEHLALLRGLTGDPGLEPRSLVFDWLTCPPASAASMLRAGRFAPPSYEDLELRSGRHWWRAHNVYYWHDFKRFDPLRLAEAYPAVREKYERRGQRLSSLRSVERVVCVVANTQPNLEAVGEEVGTVSPVFRRDEIAELRDAAEAFLGRPLEFLLVLAGHRMKEAISVEGVRRYAVPVRPTPGWRGDPAPWAEVFADYFANGTP